MPREASHDFVFYAPDLTTASDALSFEGDEHHHAAQVLRMKTGDALHVTNGAGFMAKASVVSIDKKATRIRIDADVSPRLHGRSQLAVAVLKKEAFDQVVRQATEAGVSRIIPFVAGKSHLREYSTNYLERLRRIAVSAMKQSFRSVLPAIDTPVPFDALLAALGEGGAVTVADADGVEAVACAEVRTGVVGPEAGLIPEELAALRGIGCGFARLSPHRLRAETAAVLMAAALNPPA